MWRAAGLWDYPFAMRSIIVLLACLFSSLCLAQTYSYKPFVYGFVQPEPETRLDRHIYSMLKLNGWYPVHVPARGKDPGFSYTIGLY